MQSRRHLLRRVSMTSSLFTQAGKIVPFDQPVLIILRESKGQHKELLKIIILCRDTKQDVRQGHFSLGLYSSQHCLYSDSSTELKY